jgi:hypothetical protein
MDQKAAVTGDYASLRVLHRKDFIEATIKEILHFSLFTGTLK